MRLDPVCVEKPDGRENVYSSVALWCFGARRHRTSLTVYLSPIQVGIGRQSVVADTERGWKDKPLHGT